ncbi:hypothetical protein M405DRAFT_743727, partial [Rhizopogon salebrosus TDB-379]
RRSSRYNALDQMMLTNQRLDKLVASRIDFRTRGMLSGICLSSAFATLGATFVTLFLFTNFRNR